MAKNKVYEGFSQALFFSGAVSIPRFLLDNYTYLGITDREMMMIIHIMMESNGSNEDGTIDEQIMRKMGISPLEFKNIIQNLHAKRLISVNNKSKSRAKIASVYDFSGLIDQLFELWGINQFRQMEASENQETGKRSPEQVNSPSSLKLITIFEQELGRPLTGFECEHIEKWLLASYSEELIIEALRRGVSAGIRSFRYLDSILREWEKKGIKTRLEVEAEDQSFQERQEKKVTKRSKSLKNSKNKYDDIYL